MMKNALIKLLIVEDEKVFLDDFISQINWNLEGFNITATAANGKIGLFKYEQFHPQVIITDIQMPKLNGLDMIKAIRQQDPHVIFIILSSYDEFEYARQAVKYGVEDYILKIELNPQILRKKLSEIKEKVFQLENTLLSDYIAKLRNLISSGNSEPAAINSLLHNFYNYLPLLLDELVRLSVNELKNQFQLLGKPDYFISQQPDTSEELIAYISKMISSAERIHKYGNTDNYSPVITAAMEYINRHYYDANLRIEDIAEAIGISSSRLSVLFKKETSHTIIDVLTQVRIQNAKELLRANHFKIYEIASMVGYKSTQYFSTIFFKQTGIQPTDYRKQ